VTYDGDEVTWGATSYTLGESGNGIQVPGTFADGTALTAPDYFDAGKGVVGEGKMIADLEYFCMGERGDVYRNINWPNSIPTKYLVDASKEYYVLNIHYSYIGSNESVQKSEKDITLVAEDKDYFNQVVSAITTANPNVVIKEDGVVVDE
jgi:hypothetical protein